MNKGGLTPMFHQGHKALNDMSEEHIFINGNYLVWVVGRNYPSFGEFSHRRSQLVSKYSPIA